VSLLIGLTVFNLTACSTKTTDVTDEAISEAASTSEEIESSTTEVTESTETYMNDETVITEETPVLEESTQEESETHPVEIISPEEADPPAAVSENTTVTEETQTQEVTDTQDNSLSSTYIEYNTSYLSRSLNIDQSKANYIATKLVNRLGCTQIKSISNLAIDTSHKVEVYSATITDDSGVKFSFTLNSDGEGTVTDSNGNTESFNYELQN
jgi:hypothetical protein